MFLRRKIAAGVAMFALVTTAEPAAAQSEAAIRGQVVAAADGSALSGADVKLSRVTTGESTEVTGDSTGRFAFQQLAPGEYIVSVSVEGFAPNELRLTVEPREVRVVTLSLGVRGPEERVEVTGLIPELESTHSPSSTVLTPMQLESMPVAQRVNLPEVLVTAAPGMIRGHDDFVHVRGHEVALNPLINGVSFWENPHALFSNGFSPSVIESANVMTGGFPAEYGNRFGGVVDIVTKSGLRMQNDGTLEASAGQAGRRSVAADFGGHRTGIGYYGFGSIFSSNRFLSPPDREAIHDDGRTIHGFFQLDGSLGTAGLLKAIAMGDAADFEIPKTPVDVDVRPLANAEQRARQQTTIAGWSRASSQVAVDASFYQRWSRTELLPATAPLAARAELDRDLLTVGGKVDVTRFAGPHVFKVGIDAVRLRPTERLAYDYSGYRELSHRLGLPHIHITDNVLNFSSRRSGGQISAYVQDALQLGNGVRVDMGSRFDRYDLLLSATHASPRLNVAIRAGNRATVHASYNHFFVPPPIEGVLSSAAGLTERIQEIGVALPPIGPTTENQLELGASTSMGPLRLALTGYYRASENPVHTTVWPDARIYSYASFDRARAHGLEAKLEAPGLANYGITGYLNYALGRVYFYNPVTGGFVTEADHLAETNRFLAPMDQTHTLTGGVTYRHRASGFWTGAIVEYGSGTPIGHGAEHEHADGEAGHVDAESIADAARVPGHATGSLTFGLDVGRATAGTGRSKLSFQVDIENVSDNRYLIAQEGEFSPRQFAIPRLVSVSARIRF